MSIYLESCLKRYLIMVYVAGKDELVGVQAMGHLVRLVVGDWQRLA